MATFNPSPDTTVLYGTTQLNRTTLKTFDLTFYDTNRTLSNGSVCYYIPRPPPNTPSPSIDDDGTLTPAAASCTDPVRAIRSHGAAGILFGCLFCAMLLWTLAHLQRTSVARQGTPRRARAAAASFRHGERRQFYAMLLTAVVGVAVGFVAVDVDRAVLPGVGFKLQCVFYAVLHPLMLLSLFEVLRYWNSRFACAYGVPDVQAGVLGRVTTASTVLFYVLDGVGSLLVLVRNWDGVSKQWYAEQTENVARVAVSDLRFHVGYYMLAVCLLIIIARVVLANIQYRKLTGGVPDPVFRGKLSQMANATFLSSLPTVSHVVSLYIWRISPYNDLVNQPYYYCWGVLQPVLVLFLLNMSGSIIVLPRETIVSSYDAGGTTRRHRWQSMKPAWWHNSRPRTQALIDSSNSLSLDAVRNVRGREERHGDTSRWWWQRTGEEDDVGGSRDHSDPVNIQLDVVTKGQAQQQDRVTEVASFTTADTSFSSSQSNSRHRSQQRQGPVRSMLDI